MNAINKINRKRDYIATELYEWAETFIGELDEDGEETLESYNAVFDLAKRLENNSCDEKDYENIIFHIYQINYNETKIKL